MNRSCGNLAGSPKVRYSAAYPTGRERMLATQVQNSLPSGSKPRRSRFKTPPVKGSVREGAPPLRRYGICATIPTVDDGARNRLVASQISGRNGRENPQTLGWVGRLTDMTVKCMGSNGYARFLCAEFSGNRMCGRDIVKRLELQRTVAELSTQRGKNGIIRP